MSNIRVGLQRKIKNVGSPVQSVSLVRILRQMEVSDNLKKSTKLIRKEKTKDKRNAMKKALLPAIIVSADTTCRKVSPEDERTGLIYVDLDLEDNPGVDLEKLVDWVVFERAEGVKNQLRGRQAARAGDLLG